MKHPVSAPVALMIATLTAVLGVATGLWLGQQRAGDTAQWPSYADVFTEVAPAVVNVSVDSPDSRLGSGFVVGPDRIVTARHVVVGADAVTVRDRSGTAWPARVVGTDARTDLALLETLDGTGWQSAVLGTSSRLRIGDAVIAIGNPYGLGHSLSVGLVSNRAGKLAETAPGPRVDFLQLSIPLNPGNSGGPVFDAGGRVVGVLAGTHAQGQAIAFAVPVEALQRSLPLLETGQQVSRAYLGIRTKQDGSSVMVTGVVPSSPADRGGIRVGDRISSFDGAAIGKPRDLVDQLDRTSGGQRATIRVFRDRELKVLDVQLSDWARQAVVVAGMTLRPYPGAGGEVVAVRPRSRAEDAGVQRGDLVRAVNGLPVRAPADVKDLLVGGDAARLDLLRSGAAVGAALGARKNR